MTRFFSVLAGCLAFCLFFSNLASAARPPRRMLLSADSTQGLHSAQRLHSAQTWSLCPHPGGYDCYPNSWGCLVPGCGYTTCCQQGHPTPIPPPYVSGRCWDIHNGQYVDNGVMLSCWRGGTRMCQDGQWRVTQGQCEGENYYDPYNNRHEILVGSSARGPATNTQSSSVVLAGASAPTQP